jgi:protoheme IX farnesyltransferase
MTRWLHILLQLTKFKISLFAALSTAAGFILARQGLSEAILPPVLGVFFLACGACALNQYQERQSDRIMERTQGRPLPSGRLDPPGALKISLFFLLLGMFILYVGTNWIAFASGGFAVILYNGIYTFLKRKTAFAVIPGGLIGAIPPVLGWISEGRHFPAPQILAVAFFFFIWQIPHFWLLLLNSSKDYERAGFPALTRVFTPAQLRRVTFIWIAGTAAACLLVPLFGVMESYTIYGGMFAGVLLLVWKASGLLKRSATELSLQLAFRTINLYALMVVVLLILGSLN